MTTEKITLELTLEELKQIDNSIGRYDNTAVLKDKIKDAYPLPEMKFGCSGKFEVVSYNGKNYCRYEWDDGSHTWYKEVYPDEGVLMIAITDKETERLLDGLFFNDVKKGNCNEPKPRSPLDEVVDKMVKEHQEQKLWNRLREELGYSVDCCDEIVDLVEDWIADEQSASGSQNVDTELLVDGFNDCVQKMKQMLR